MHILRLFMYHSRLIGRKYALDFHQLAMDRLAVGEWWDDIGMEFALRCVDFVSI